jgi:hypothetical protein
MEKIIPENVKNSVALKYRSNLIKSSIDSFNGKIYLPLINSCNNRLSVYKSE